MQSNKPWWKERLVIVQTNLQAADTDKIDPPQLVRQIKDMDADALLFNVGGIYAWYHSEVEHHHVSEYLPKDRDILAEVIDACHEAGLKFIARYDFSLAHDDTYGMHPEWFVQLPDRENLLAGEKRPGNWDLLYATCINSDYCRDAVAVPVLTESLTRYDIDGVFFNWPHPRECWCDECRRLYSHRYHTAMPDDLKDIAPDWHSYLYRENVRLLRDAIQAARPGTPLVLYSEEKPLVDDAHPAEIICAETRDSLSEGLADVWSPQVTMKHIESYSESDRPVWGFVHSAPGLDWRHVGIPAAEYDFWLSQIVSGGWTLVHSVTGIPDTIYDKRVLRCVEKVNRKAHRVFPALEGTTAAAQIAVLWDKFHPSRAWMDVLDAGQRPYALLETPDVNISNMRKYDLIIIPQEYSLDYRALEELALYVSEGGRILQDGPIRGNMDMLYDILGLKRYQYRSKPLAASYLRFEEAGAALRTGGLEDTLFVGIRGPVAYTRADGAEVLATLVPPFVDPPQLAGKPPERASIPTMQTDMALCTVHTYGKGCGAATMLSLAELYRQIGMVEHLQICLNLIDILLPDPAFAVTRRQGLHAVWHRGEGKQVVQLLNSAGTRPLHDVTPLLDIDITLRLPGFKKVEALLEGENMEVVQDADTVRIRLPRLDEWAALLITAEE